MKRLLLAAVAIALFAVPGLSNAQQKYKFALVPKAMNNPFFDLARDGCMQAMKELPNVECVYIGPAEHTESEQVQILQLPQDQGERAAFIGTHNYDIGVNLAKIAQGMKPKGGKICLQTGGASAANHNERLQGIRDTLGGRSNTQPPGDPLKGENGWTEVDGCPLITNDDSATAVQQLQDILGKYGDLDVYITTGAFTQWSDNAFRQAMDPYKDKLKSGQLVFVSADTLDMQMQQLKDGLSDGQVGQKPFDMGKLAMYRLLDLKNGKKLTDPEYTGLDVCTKDNADSCKK